MFWPLLRSIKRDCRGIAAVEFAFVAPVMLMIFAGIAQVGMSYFVKSHMQDVAYDITRRVVVGAMTEQQAVEYAQMRLGKLGINFSIDVVPAGEEASPTDKVLEPVTAFATAYTADEGGGASDNTVTTVITAKAADIAHFDILGFYQDDVIQVSASMLAD